MCTTCGWQEYENKCKQMVEDKKFRWDFALLKIESMWEWIETKKHVTPPMKMALDNIYDTAGIAYSKKSSVKPKYYKNRFRTFR
jgi:hypothetical protein